MKKSEFSQVSIAFTPDQRAWLDAQKKLGWNRSALVRQALDAFIAKSFAATIEEDDDEDDFCGVCGGGQGYCNLVELPMEGMENE